MPRPSHLHLPPLAVVMFGELSEVVAQLTEKPTLIECGTKSKDTIEQLGIEARARGVGQEGVEAVEYFWNAGVRVDGDVGELERMFGKDRG